MIWKGAGGGEHDGKGVRNENAGHGTMRALGSLLAVGPTARTADFWEISFSLLGLGIVS